MRNSVMANIFHSLAEVWGKREGRREIHISIGTKGIEVGFKKEEEAMGKIDY